MATKEKDEKQWGQRWIAIDNNAQIEKYAAERVRSLTIMGGVK